MDRNLPYGYAGTIARINLTDSTVSLIPTSDYAPKYLGGRGICNKIFWDEVGPGVGAFDPENKLILMTGPTTGTGIPTGGRTTMCGISPNNIPEQYCWGNIGGWFGSYLKFAGFDGFILEGKAPKHTYLMIEDGKISFRDADEDKLWGLLVHETQLRLDELLGDEIASLVTGPAGENLVRISSVTSNNDNAIAKAGFGAVMGAKNLKSVSVRGTGTIRPCDVEKVLRLRQTMGNPQRRLNPVREKEIVAFRPHISFMLPEGKTMKEARLSCSYGCNQRCNLFTLDTKSGFGEKRTNQVHKCVDVYAFQMLNDSGWSPGMSFHTKENYVPACLWMGGTPPKQNPDDPYLEILNKRRVGNTLNFWDGDYDRGNVIADLCCQYGVDKWDIIIWLMTWLVMAKRSGVLTDEEFGMEIDPSSEDFMKRLMEQIVYRKGYWGNLLAEGMGRAIRTLGKEKYGDTIYKGVISNVMPGKQLDIPISWESAWGHSFHWQGRGFQGINDITAWLPATLMLMTNTRDSQTNSHIHGTIEYMLEAKKDPCHDSRVAELALMGEIKAEMKESVTTCDWQSPDIFWTDMECEMLEAAAGIKMTEEEMWEYCMRSKNLFRAILIRNHGRTREMEVGEAYRPLQYPDAEGLTVTREEFEDLVDLYYEKWGWDLKTGWPTRETYEKYGLGEVADELEKLGKLP